MSEPAIVEAVDYTGSHMHVIGSGNAVLRSIR